MLFFFAMSSNVENMKQHWIMCYVLVVADAMMDNLCHRCVFYSKTTDKTSWDSFAFICLEHIPICLNDVKCKVTAMLLWLCCSAIRPCPVEVPLAVHVLWCARFSQIFRYILACHSFIEPMCNVYKSLVNHFKLPSCVDFVVEGKDRTAPASATVHCYTCQS